MRRTWVKMVLCLILFTACLPINSDISFPGEISQSGAEPDEPIIEVIIPTQTPTMEVAEPEQTIQSEEEWMQFFVAVNGSPAGSGKMDDPWDLQTALNHPDDVQPGDTIWLREGTYFGQFKSHLKGDENNPIIVKNFPGERAILSDAGLMLDIQDSWYVDFWGFEIACLDNSRDPEKRPLWGFGVRTHQGNQSHHIRFINMIIHDVHTQGFGWWITNTDSEIYGSLIFYNGVNQLDHGIYVKNQDGVKTIRDNFIFDNASHGIHAYSSDEDTLNNLVIIGNTVFNNGSIGYSTRKNVYGIYERNILVGGYNLVKNAQVEENYTYYPGVEGESFNLGYRYGSTDSVVRGNYFIGGGITLGGIVQNLTFSENIIYSPGLSSRFFKNYPENSYYSDKPTRNMIILRQNLFEPNRFHITIYNWEGKDEIFLANEMFENLSLQPETNYQLHNVQDFYGDVILGEYDGQGITISMLNHSVQQPIGLEFLPASTYPEFGAFILVFEE